MGEKNDLISIDDYLEFESTKVAKNEYLEGHVFPVHNTSLTHNVIRTNVMFEIMTSLKGKGYRIFTGDTRLWVTDESTNANVIYYPDLMICEGQEVVKNFVTDPVVVVEIVSEDSARQDRHEKLGYYSRLKSIKEYILIDEREKSIERYSLEGKAVLSVLDTEKHLNFNSLGFKIMISDIYNGIVFAG